MYRLAVSKVLEYIMRFILMNSFTLELYSFVPCQLLSNLLPLRGHAKFNGASISSHNMLKSTS